MKPYKNPVPSLGSDNQKIEEKNFYIEKQGVYFVFIDVLGFKNNYEKHKESYEQVFLFYLKLMEETAFSRANKEDYYVGQTSDSLYFYTKRVDYLVDFLKLYSYFSLYAMTQNVFFRGGIAKGTLSYKNKYQFYGNSVIRAYSMENNIAVNPRIMIDEETYQDIMATGLSNKLFEGEERHYFIPFAYYGIKDEVDEQLRRYNVNLEGKQIDINRIGEVITKNLQDQEYESKNYDKYVYLKRQYEKIQSMRR